MLLADDDVSPEITATKIVLATVVVVFALYQVGLIAVVYGWLPPTLPARRVASRAHRLVGMTTALLTVGIAITCISSYNVGDALEKGPRTAAHVIGGSLLLLLLAAKLVVVRRGPRQGQAHGRALPVLGLSVASLFVLTWATSALAKLT